MDARACQWSPVAMSTPSISVRSTRNSRISRCMVQSLVPYLLSMVCLTASRRSLLISQMATNWTSGSPIIHVKSEPPRLWIPIPPITIRLLGATAPPLPNAEAGMMVGMANTVLAAALRFRNCRRVTAEFASGSVVMVGRCYLNSFRMMFLNCTFIGGPGCICSAMMPLLAAVFASLSVIWHINTPLT